MATGRTFHRAAIFEKEDIGGGEGEDMMGHGIGPFGRC